jgi:hypothetical protein
MRQSTRLASVVLAEPQLFQFDSIAAGGVSCASVDGGAHQFGNSVWQFGSVIWFGNLVWQFCSAF